MTYLSKEAENRKALLEAWMKVQKAARDFAIAYTNKLQKGKI